MHITPTSDTTCYIEEWVPVEIMLMIFTLLPTQSYISISKVNKRWRNICFINHYWRVAFKNDFPNTADRLKSNYIQFIEVYKKNKAINKNIKNSIYSRIIFNNAHFKQIFCLKNYLFLRSDQENRNCKLTFTNLEKNLKEGEATNLICNSPFVKQYVDKDNLFICLKSSIYFYKLINNKLELINDFFVEDLLPDYLGSLKDFSIHNNQLYLLCSDYTLFILKDYETEAFILSTHNLHHDGILNENKYYYKSNNSKSLVILNIENDFSELLLKLNGASGIFHVHGNKVFIDMKKQSCINVWDNENGQKLEQSYRYFSDRYNFVHEIQIYDDKVFALIHFANPVTPLSSIYIWQINSADILTIFCEVNVINCMAYFDHKLALSYESFQQHRLAIIDYDVAKDEINKGKRKFRDEN